MPPCWTPTNLDMGKTLKPTCKMCRREGVSLCGREKCAVKRRPYPPGAHGKKRQRRLSGYGTQLREKQKAKRLYNVMERQFRNYFGKAKRAEGDTGQILVQLLERRLDNVIYRAGFARTRRQARQLVSHGFIAVNGVKTDIASYLVKSGEEITIRENKQGKKVFDSVKDAPNLSETPSWISVDKAGMKATITSLPEGETVTSTVFDPKLIVEFYSR